MSLRLLGAAGLSLGVAAAAGAAQAQSTAVTSGEARASIIRTISLASDQPLNFGLIAPATSPTDVTITPDGDISASQPGVLIPGAVSAGSFVVVGEPDRIYFVDLPDTITLTSGEGGGNAMSITAVTLDCDEGVGQATSTCQFDADGNQLLTVGGTLGVDAAQPPGEYVGTYTVTARYQ